MKRRRKGITPLKSIRGWIKVSVLAAVLTMQTALGGMVSHAVVYVYEDDGGRGCLASVWSKQYVGKQHRKQRYRPKHRRYWHEPKYRKHRYRIPKYKGCGDWAKQRDGRLG